MKTLWSDEILSQKLSLVWNNLYYTLANSRIRKLIQDFLQQSLHCFTLTLQSVWEMLKFNKVIEVCWLIDQIFTQKSDFWRSPRLTEVVTCTWLIVRLGAQITSEVFLLKVESLMNCQVTPPDKPCKQIHVQVNTSQSWTIKRAYVVGF